MIDKITVLAVDDIELNLRIIQDVLKVLGTIEILEARNGKEALSCLAQRSDVDIVLLDLQMPVMNGYDTLRYLKAHERFRDIPVIVVTSEKTEVEYILDMGASDFMSKPFDPGELKLRVMNHVRSKKLGDLTRPLRH
jgi:putative two-component system response regulator